MTPSFLFSRLFIPVIKYRHHQLIKRTVFGGSMLYDLAHVGLEFCFRGKIASWQEATVEERAYFIAQKERKGKDRHSISLLRTYLTA